MKRSEVFSLAIGELSGDELRAQRRRAVFRWIRAGGIVIANDAQAAATFRLSDKIVEGESLQITTNLRAIGNACRRLPDYVVYLWNCELQADYELCIGRRAVGVPRERLVCRVSPACFAGSHPQAELEIYRGRLEQPVTEEVSACLVLPRGLCAFIYQRSGAGVPRARGENRVHGTLSDAEVMEAMLEANP